MISLFLLFFIFLNFIFNNNSNLLNYQNYKSLDQNYLNNSEFSDKVFSLEEEISAKGVIVREFSGKILYEKNKDQVFPTASLIKILVAYLSLQVYNPNDIFIFSKNAINQYGQVGNFKIGEKISFKDILKFVLITSSNDATYLLIENYGYDNFMKKINETLDRWNLKKTKIVEPTGISHLNISTPLELSEIAFRVFSNSPEIFQITKEESFFLKGKYFWNTNLLLNNYKDIIIGGKTGFTDEAGECFLLLVKFKNSPPVAIIILNSDNRFKDAEKIIQALKKYYE